MNLNNGKCQVLHLGQGKPGYTDRLGNEKLESEGPAWWKAENETESNALAARRAISVLGCISSWTL